MPFKLMLLILLRANCTIDGLRRQTVDRQHAFAGKLHILTGDFWPYWSLSTSTREGKEGRRGEGGDAPPTATPGSALATYIHSCLKLHLQLKFSYNSLKRFLRYRTNNLLLWLRTDGQTDGQPEDELNALRSNGDRKKVHVKFKKLSLNITKHHEEN